MIERVHHVAVLFDASDAGERALQEAVAIADEHEALLTVIVAVPHERRSVGCAICTARRGYWNAVLDAEAEADLARARDLLGDREPAPRLRAVSGAGAAAAREAAAELGCDVLVLGRRHRLARRRRGRGVEVIGVPAA